MNIFYLTIKDIISIICIVILLLVINYQAKKIEKLQDKIEDLQFKLRINKDSDK